MIIWVIIEWNNLIKYDVRRISFQAIFNTVFKFTIYFFIIF